MQFTMASARKITLNTYLLRNCLTALLLNGKCPSAYLFIGLPFASLAWYIAADYTCDYAIMTPMRFCVYFHRVVRGSRKIAVRRTLCRNHLLQGVLTEYLHVASPEAVLLPVFLEVARVVGIVYPPCLI
jgi:hypothetical protein